MVGFSNPPYAFVRPFFFDDLFADEISMLEKIDADGKITRREAFKFFTRYCSQPALDSALKRIAKTDGAQTEAANKPQYAYRKPRFVHHLRHAYHYGFGFVA